MTPLEQAEAILKAAEEIVALKASAGPGDLSTAQIKPNSEGEWVECPACYGEGMVDAETYVNFDDKPLTVQFYGIGECFGNYQNLFDTAIKHAPSIARALIEKHRALEEAEARLALLESVLAEAREALSLWLNYAEEVLPEFDLEECDTEPFGELCPRCRPAGCIKMKIDEARSVSNQIAALKDRANV